MSKILIITGGNKGIGSGIVLEYKQNGYTIISIARSRNESSLYNDVVQVQLNLSETNAIENVFSEILRSIDSSNLETIVLINNAGTLGMINRLERIEAPVIELAIQLNIVAPFILNSIFLRETKNWNCTKKIVNISSGAAIKPYYGWSVYCATKAAIDMMTKAIAIEQDTIEKGVKVIAIYPGVVDTAMQEQIRNSDSQKFIDVQRFIDFKESGSLVSTEIVGKEIFQIINSDNFPNGAILNISDYR
jgi:benzil reductase ((S)-benzoin forming)